MRLPKGLIATGIVIGSAFATNTSPNLGSGSHYAVARQTDAAGNTGTSKTAGPVTR